MDSMRQHVGMIEGKDLDGDPTYSGNYGLEVMVDCLGCDPVTFSQASIRKYFTALIKLIKMERGRPPLFYYNKEARTTTAVQFILTSNITVHIDKPAKSVHVNIFSCKNYDEYAAQIFTQEWFKAGRAAWHKVYRV